MAQLNTETKIHNKPKLLTLLKKASSLFNNEILNIEHFLCQIFEH